MEQKGLDPEKIKLLKEKHKEKKKKCSESRSKTAQELYDSSSTDRFQQPKRKSNTVQDIMNNETYYYGGRDVFEDHQKKLQDSPSRVSCALKKLVGSEYACVGCLAIVFVVSIVAGLLLVFKVMPSSADMMTVNDCDLMKNVHRPKGKRQLNDDYDIFGGRKYREKSSDDGFQFDTFSTATEKKEFGYNEHPEQSSNDEITDILNANEIMGSENEKLRDFYKRLIETDAEIKRVKQNLQNNYLIKSRDDKQDLERIKRSLNKTQAGTLKQRSHQENGQFNTSRKLKIKRHKNGTNDVYGIVIKEQEIMVYEPKNFRKTFHNNYGKLNEKHFKYPFCKHKQKLDDSLTQNNFKIKEQKNYANDIEKERSTPEYHKNKMNAMIQNDEVNESSKSKNNLDVNNVPTVESLDVSSNITMDKENDILHKPENIIRRRRLLVSRKNDKAENVKNGNISKTLLRKSRSLMSFKEEKQYTTIKRDIANGNNYMNGTDFNHGNYKSRRLFQYDTSSTLVSDFVTTSTLNNLHNFTYFHKASATGELDYNILPEISTVDDSKYDEENKKIDIINKVTKNISSYNTYHTTKSLRNKTEVKREADSKFVFWDKLYDNNEYGEKFDYLDNKKRRDGYSKITKMQKSKDWLKARVRKLMNRRKKSKKNNKNLYNGLSTKAINVEESFQSIPSQRKIRTFEYDNDKNMENIFKKLNAKMETICREAAYAIQNTRNIKVREDKADITTSTLMQRLVRMMRDLVDIQVQEKTCVELPPDLRQFLEWLILPTEVNPQADSLNPDISDYVAAKREYGDGIDESSNVTEQSLSEEDTDQAEINKIQCMETIHAVNNLVDQYEGFSSEDKNKLFGVKDYLQRQLQYLNKLVGDVDIQNHNFYRDPEDRYKRETNKMKHKRKFSKRMKMNRFGDFLQRLRMKHTKATTQAMATSFANNFTVKDKEISFAGQIQKNINDVYNRALEEAKRITIEDINITIT